MSLRDQVEARKKEKKAPANSMVVYWPDDCDKAIYEKQKEMQRQSGVKVLKWKAAVALMQELLKK